MSWQHSMQALHSTPNSRSFASQRKLIVKYMGSSLMLCSILERPHVILRDPEAWEGEFLELQDHRADLKAKVLHSGLTHIVWDHIRSDIPQRILG